MLTEVTPANQIQDLVAFFDPVGGDSARRDMAVTVRLGGRPPVAQFDIITTGNGCAQQRARVRGGRHVQGGQAQIAVEGSVQLVEQLLGARFGGGLLLKGELVA